MTCFFPQKHSLQEKLSLLIERSDVDLLIFFFERETLFTLDLNFRNSISKQYNNILNTTNFHKLLLVILCLIFTTNFKIEVQCPVENNSLTNKTKMNQI